MRLERIISGGQTGVDRGGLDAAIALGIPHGGACPRGRRAEDGRIPDVYELHETDSAEYAERTLQNVRDADATLILTRGDLQGGTLLTAELAVAARTPLLVVDLREVTRDPGAVRQRFLTWLHRHGVRTLNVAGPRESQAPGIQAATCAFLTEALAAAGSGRR